MSIADRLVEFVGALRTKGINAGPSESIDAAEVAALLQLDNRERFRAGLAAALVRREHQREIFDQTFDIYFPLGIGEISAEVANFTADLVAALASADRLRLRELAEFAVNQFGMVGQEGTETFGWSAQRTLSEVQPTQLIVEAANRRAGMGGPLSQRELDLVRQEVRNEVQAFSAMVAAAARRRTAEVRGRDRITAHAVRPMVRQVEFLSADRKALLEMKRQVQPLARKLATRLAMRRRKRRRGKIDIRRTIRKAMSTGGVPFSPVYVQPRNGKPDLLLICDVSGSVAGFSQFTMLLVRALAEQFNRVRVFAFVNSMAEVTEIINERHDDLIEQIRQRAKITSWHTSSDYGAAFDQFAANHLAAIGPRTSVLILGDARNNNLPPGLDSLAIMNERSRRIFWLNPEHHRKWGLGDSVAHLYAEVVEMHEVRTIDQLAQFVGRVLPV